LTAFAAFCPALLFDTAIWKQIDGAFLLPMLLCVLFLEEQRYYRSALAFGIALAIKPQALLLGPVMAATFLIPVINAASHGGRASAVAAKSETVAAESESLTAAILRVITGTAIALAPALLLGLPFFGFSNLIPGLIAKYTETSASYPYATVNAFNFFAMLGGNWVDQSEKSLIGIAWQTLGVFNLIILTSLLIVFTVRLRDQKRFSPALLAAFYTAGIFTFSHRMHERYLLMGVLFTLLAAAMLDDLYLFLAGAGLSLTSFLNIACVYAVADTDDSFLTSETSREFIFIVGAVETAFYLLLAIRTWQLSSGEAKASATVPIPDRTGDEGMAVGKEAAAPHNTAAPNTTGRAATVLTLTVMAAMLNFTNLGDTKAPETVVGNPAGTIDVSFNIEGTDAPAMIRVYPEICWEGTFTITSDTTGDEVVNIPLVYTSVFTWQRADFVGEGEGTSFTAHITNASVLEAAVYDGAGNILEVASPATGAEESNVHGNGMGEGNTSALFDEQDLVPQKFDRRNSMYFDEVYHGRTAYEQANGLTIYETTHPPLGKDLIMIGIQIFGMNAFAWRFMPALFGVLIIPLMYLFVKRLTGNGRLAVFTAALFVTDFMRFIESRLSTIDIFTTFFILLSAYCMFCYMDKALHFGVKRAWLPALGSGIAIGLAIAVKWNGAYAGIALAAVYFYVLYRRYGKERFREDFAFSILYGCVFFLLVPFLIYLLSYIPFTWGNPSFGWRDWWDAQVFMYQYHSTNEATNPFSSNWYTWPLLLRPYWYYADYELPTGMVASIASLGNVVTWTGGMICILVLFWRELKGSASRADRFVLIFYIGQLLPWILVTRTTYAYHYLPISIFGITAIALVLGEAKLTQRRQRAVMAAILIVSVSLFLAFFPVLAGIPVPAGYGHGLELLKSWGFYL
jgi:dolichyl-phosphate-mannose-protein mannosyltransferase